MQHKRGYQRDTCHIEMGKNIADLRPVGLHTRTKKTEDEAATPQMVENWGLLSIVNPALQIARVHDHDILWFFSTCRQIQFVDTFLNPLNEQSRKP